MHQGTHGRNFARGVGRAILALAALYPASLFVLSLLHIVLPQRNGFLALTQVFAPYLFLPLVVVLPFAFVRRATGLRVAIAACCVVFCVQYFPRLNLTQAREGTSTQQVSVMSWNVYVSNKHVGTARQMLAAGPADILALQETGAEWQQWIESELVEVYPYRRGRFQGEATSGLALLSTYPILDAGVPEEVTEVPGSDRVMWARLDLGQGRTLLVINAHPYPPAAAPRSCPSPTCYNPVLRDTHLLQVRDLVSRLSQGGEPVLLMGDFNVTDREPGYRDVSKGLLDAHRAVGTGMGATWRPGAIMSSQGPLLRIDYLFSGPTLAPLTKFVDCSFPGSDHCAVRGTFEVR